MGWRVTFLQWATGLLIGGALALAAPFAWALPSTRLVYVRSEGAEQCPEAIELRLAVMHRLSYNPFEPNAKDCIVLVVRREGNRLEASVELVDEQGISRGLRELDAPIGRCDELIAAASLSISLAIDPEHANREIASDEVAVAPAKVPAPAPEAKAAAVRAEAPRLPSHPAIVRPIRSREITLSVHELSGALVKPTFGIGLGYGYRHAWLSLSAEGNAELPVSQRLRGRGELNTWLLSASLVPCLRGTALRFCGLGSLGVLGAKTTGVAQPKNDYAWYGALGLRLGTEGRVSRRWRLGVHVDLLRSLSTYQANFAGSTVWESRRLSGLLGLVGAWDIE
jgi:hypothetical protein